MEAIYRTFNSNYLRLQRHAFSTHPQGHSMFSDLDDLIRQKETFINYVKFEYSVSIFYNLMMALSTLFYVYSRFYRIWSCDWCTTVWLLLVSSIKILETLPKGILIYQTVRIGIYNTDPIICSRRLMHMTRSNVFFYNTVLGYSLLISYTAFFLLMKKSGSCDKAQHFYYNVNMLVWGFFLRLIISFINYYFHFKYGVNEADIANTELYTDYQNRVSPDVLNLIETHNLTKENIEDYLPLNEEKERDVCCICMNIFSLDEMIRILPCNRKHIFHKCCIDKWLGKNKACPTCRKEISKKSIQKQRIY